ncbi:MAG: hypothetical protein JNJ86_12335 [Chitinophagaceae bacterium]|nr:hypothetical protein [Chitinophagaceae bacterium]
MKKNCFVKEKGKKESLGIMRLPCQQKGNGINGGFSSVDSFCLCRSLFAALTAIRKPHIFAFA